MAKVRRGPRSMAASSARVVKATTAGEPQPKPLRADFPRTVLRRLQSRRSVKTLIKQQPDGTTNVVATLPQDASGNKVPNGVLQPGSGGYKGATVVYKDQNTSTRQAKGTRVVKTPRPLGTGRVRNPFRIGRG